MSSHTVITAKSLAKTMPAKRSISVATSIKEEEDDVKSLSYCETVRSLVSIPDDASSVDSDKR